MPTVILLDVSLSMSRPLLNTLDETTTRRQLAIKGIHTLLDYITINCKLEFVSLIIFSSKYEQLVPFTRDYTEIKDALDNIPEFDKKIIETGLYGASHCVTKEWGVNSHCKIILITDGVIGIGESSLKNLINSYSDSEQARHLSLPFCFPSSLHIVHLLSSSDTSFAESSSLLNKLVSINKDCGDVTNNSGNINSCSVNILFENLAKEKYVQHVFDLKCGTFECRCEMVPPMMPLKKNTDSGIKTYFPTEILNICGFLNINDVSSPPFISKHLILPYVPNKNSAEETEALAMLPTLTVLLHASLKIANTVALLQIAEDWFGIVYSHADTKKKSNLMLSSFQPGLNVISWLGNFKQMGPADALNPNPYLNGKTPFPVGPEDGRSYSQNSVVWIQTSGLQADIQKILRNARKLPEKQAHFFKELNRLRKTALSICFYDLLEAMAGLLERECACLSASTHPSAALQMNHAISRLRDHTARDPNQIINPLFVK